MLYTFHTVSEKYWPGIVDRFGSNRVYYTIMLFAIQWVVILLHHAFYYFIEVYGFFQESKVNKVWDSDNHRKDNPGTTP